MRPGAAAIVGDERITTDTLEEAVDRGLADPQAEQQLGSDLPAFQRLLLSRLINRVVLAEAAELEGVSVSAGQVAEQVASLVERAGDRATLEQQAAQSGVAPQDLEPFVRDIVLDQALGDELTADVEVPQAQLEELYQQGIQQFDQIRSRHILVPEEEVARTILGNVQRDPTRFAALAAQFSTDTTNKDEGGELPLAGRGLFDPVFEEAIFGAEPGDILLVSTSFGWHVVEVLERQVTTLEEARPDLRRAALEQERVSRVQELIQQTAADLGVTVNPRFGRWNAETAQVEADESPNGVLTPAPEGGVPAQPEGEQLPPPPAGDPNQPPVPGPAEPPADAPPQPVEPPADAPADPAAPSPAG